MVIFFKEIGKSSEYRFAVLSRAGAGHYYRSVKFEFNDI